MPQRVPSDSYVPISSKDPVQLKFNASTEYKNNPTSVYPVQPFAYRQVSPVKKDSDPGNYNLGPSKDPAVKYNLDPKYTDAQQIDYKVQKFKEEQMRKIADKKREQQDLRQLYQIETMKKNENMKNLRENAIRVDMQYSNQAKIALERDRSMQALKREQQLRITEENTRAFEEKKRFEKTLNLLDSNEAKRMQENYAKNVEFNEQKYQEKFKNIEAVQNLRKQQFEANLAQSKAFVSNPSNPKFNPQASYDNYQDDPYTQNKLSKEEEVRTRILLLEELRRKERAEKDLGPRSPKQLDQQEFEKNQKRFFGLDDEPRMNRDQSDQELPSSSEFKPTRFAKTNLKSISHDPITGAVNNYNIDRPKPRTLGTKAPEVFPGKIYDSPAQVEYELPKHTKKAPRNQIFNPLTFETQTIGIEKKERKFGGAVENEFRAGSDEQWIAEKIAKARSPNIGQLNNPLQSYSPNTAPPANSLPIYSPNIAPSNPPPIYKGMGYKKSSIFS